MSHISLQNLAETWSKSWTVGDIYVFYVKLKLEDREKRRGVPPSGRPPGPLRRKDRLLDLLGLDESGVKGGGDMLLLLLTYERGDPDLTVGEGLRSPVGLVADCGKGIAKDEPKAVLTGLGLGLVSLIDIEGVTDG